MACRRLCRRCGDKIHASERIPSGALGDAWQGTPHSSPIENTFLPVPRPHILHGHSQSLPNLHQPWPVPENQRQPPGGDRRLSALVLQLENDHDTEDSYSIYRRLQSIMEANVDPQTTPVQQPSRPPQQPQQPPLIPPAVIRRRRQQGHSQGTPTPPQQQTIPLMAVPIQRRQPTATPPPASV